MSTPPQDQTAPAAPAASAAPATQAEPAAAPADGKTVQCLVLDTGALIKNDPSVSTLLAQTHELYTIPAVLAEIRDADTRRRVDTTLRPFLTIRTPKPDSIRFITAFARRTGDLEVLSPPDIHLLALTYELECERNGGDGRLRNSPGQKHLNGMPPPADDEKPSESDSPGEEGAQPASREEGTAALPQEPIEREDSSVAEAQELLEAATLEDAAEESPAATTAPEGGEVDDDTTEAQQSPSQESAEDDEVDDDEDGDSDDSDGWITPSNLKKHVAQDQHAANTSSQAPVFLQAALLTTDYAMQNVALRINLNLLSSALFRITRLRTYCLRCHGCFAITKDMTKQFCHKCGQPTLIRTSCSIDEDGVFQVHLRSNFQYIKRGNVYSVPKPAHGTPSGKMAKKVGGGKSGWGHNLVLAEDQKEYTRAKTQRERTRQRDLMDENYLPGLLTGERTGGDERIRVGAGRGVNARKRRA